MTVFKGYLMVIRKNLNMILMYVAIFAGISIMIMQTVQGSGMVEDFTAIRLDVAVIDRDDTVLSRTFQKLMEREHNVTEIKDDAQTIQEALYYKEIDYVLVIPEGAQDAFAADAGKADVVQSITDPDSTMSFYVDSQVNSLLNQIRTYQAGGFSFERACESALALGEKEADITLMDINGNAGIRPKYNYFFAYMPYAFLGAAVMTLSIVILEYKKRDIRRRMQSCCVPFLHQNLAMIGAFLVVGAMIWAGCILMSVVVCKGAVFGDANVGYYLLNSSSCMLVALSLGYLTGMISNGPAELSGFSNVISLGLCFLGGIFVPLEMLGDGVKKVAQFLPTYWYSKINGILGDFTVLGSEQQSIIRKGLLIQVLFAAACFAVTIMVRRHTLQEEE